MTQAPYFGTLCGQSHAGLGLMVLLVPVSFLVIALTLYQAKVSNKMGKKTASVSVQETLGPEMYFASNGKGSSPTPPSL